REVPLLRGNASGAGSLPVRAPGSGRATTLREREGRQPLPVRRTSHQDSAIGCQGERGGELVVNAIETAGLELPEPVSPERSTQPPAPRFLHGDHSVATPREGDVALAGASEDLAGRRSYCGSPAIRADVGPGEPRNRRGGGVGAARVVAAPGA